MSAETKIVAKNLDFYYGHKKALKNINMVAPKNKVTALIGPSGCGKSTFIRTLNRMNDVIPGTRVEGQVIIDGQDIYSHHVDVVELRRRVGMVFQKPNPFPKSIFDNIAYGLRINGMKERKKAVKCREDEFPLIFQRPGGILKDLEVHLIRFHQGKTSLAKHDHQVKLVCEVRVSCISPLKINCERFRGGLLPCPL